MDEPPRPPLEPAQIAMWLLALLVVAGVLVVGTLAVRCVVWPIAVCDRDWGLHEIFAELLVVLMALITRGGSRRE